MQVPQHRRLCFHVNMRPHCFSLNSPVFVLLATILSLYISYELM